MRHRLRRGILVPPEQLPATAHADVLTPAAPRPVPRLPPRPRPRRSRGARREWRVRASGLPQQIHLAWRKRWPQFVDRQRLVEATLAPWSTSRGSIAEPMPALTIDSTPRWPRRGTRSEVDASRANACSTRVGSHGVATPPSACGAVGSAARAVRKVARGRPAGRGRRAT